MADKAELLEQVEERELTIGQLSGETETIGKAHRHIGYPNYCLSLSLYRGIYYVISEPERSSESKI